MEPITSLPSNAYLPKSVHALADEWRAAAQRVKDIRKDHNDAVAALAQAQRDDAEALKEAARTGAPMPDGEHEKATRARIDDAKRRLPVLEADRDAIGRRLVVALRDDQARRHLVDTTATGARAALTAYLEALDDAERKVSAAHRALTDATAVLHVIKALDTGEQVRLLAQPPAAPSFTGARSDAHKLAQQLAALDERKPPRERHIRLVNGRNVTVPRTLAADFLRDHQVDAWLDGWPPEEPSRPLPSGTPGHQFEDFRNTPSHFTPRGDAA
ncbi:hypothetical protein [Streptomyces sp. JB150]|uniref:hypothetical protein n=1 Tax=Streptomyces sp. JB150 TaxID=2714844 RepID=UPI00140CEEFC|nr:hypothetical protein [Streptomyces sp. JB150]QIJ62223.1 hypothetical protein G7Z13_09320 [Streptomyces sp. JB150]